MTGFTSHTWKNGAGSVRFVLGKEESEMCPVSCSMLLGWKHCRHHDHEEDEPIPPTQLANLLPDNLESLHLAFDHLHENRNGCRYVCDIVRGIVADAARLKALKRISITRHTQHRSA